MVEIGFRFFQRALFDFHIRFRLMQSGHRLIEIGLRGILFRDQLLRPRLIDFRASSSAACALRQIAFGLRHRRLKKGRIDLRDNLARFHLRIKIDEKFLDVTRNLTADLHVHDRVQRAGGGHGLRDRTARHRRRLKLSRTRPFAASKAKRRAQRERRAIKKDHSLSIKQSRATTRLGSYCLRSDCGQR